MAFAFPMHFNVWRSGTLVHAQAGDDCKFFTSTDEADALAQAGYDKDQGDTIVYGQPERDDA